MTFEGMGEIFEGDSADTCAEKIPLVSMGGQAEGLACADPGARNPIGACGNMLSFPLFNYCTILMYWCKVFLAVLFFERRVFLLQLITFNQFMCICPYIHYDFSQ